MAMAAPVHASSVTRISSTKSAYPLSSLYRPSSLALSHTLSLRSTLRRRMVAAAAAATTAIESEPRSNSAAPSKSLPFRVGHGFDLHRLEPGYPLIIGGIDIPHDRGCEAHSDGDVLLHCVVDAILGALGLPDIGQIFPDSDPKWKGAPSSVFIKEAILVGPSDWEDHSSGKEGAERYRVHNLPSCIQSPGVYELGLCVSPAGLRRGVHKLRSADIVVVYLER